MLPLRMRYAGLVIKAERNREAQKATETEKESSEREGKRKGKEFIGLWDLIFLEGELGNKAQKRSAGDSGMHH